MRRLILAAALALAGACGDDGGAASGTPDARPATNLPDAGVQGIRLQTWVEGLVTERSSDEAEPDTVEDKVIIDTEDPAAFDQYFP